MQPPFMSSRLPELRHRLLQGADHHAQHRVPRYDPAQDRKPFLPGGYSRALDLPGPRIEALDCIIYGIRRRILVPGPKSRKHARRLDQPSFEVVPTPRLTTQQLQHATVHASISKKTQTRPNMRRNQPETAPAKMNLASAKHSVKTAT